MITAAADGSMTGDPQGHVALVRSGVLDWLESVRHRGDGWGRWKYNAAMTRPWALQASGIAIDLLHRLGALAGVSDARKAEVVAFLQSCQDPGDHLLKDPLETEADHEGDHTWEQIWGQRNGAAVAALGLLGAEPLLPLAKAQFADLRGVDGRAWTLSLDWRNPWMHGESWYRAIHAYLRTLPVEERDDTDPVLAGMFAAIESEVLDPKTGLPTRRGCSDDPARAMAGLFKIMFGYLAVGRPLPRAEQAVDSTLALQRANGEFGYPRNMCMNWDALWVLRELDRQLEGSHRHADIVGAADATCEVLLNEYHKDDGGFAFHGEHCMVNHHSVRLCERPLPISDMLGTSMCLRCLEYGDEWHGRGPGDTET